MTLVRLDRSPAGGGAFGPSTFGDLVGGNYAEFESDGTLAFYGNATCWKDQNFGAILGRGASAPDLINLDTTSIQIAAFDGTSTLEQVSAHSELQHDYATGTDIIAHIHWMPVNGNAGNIKWFLEYYIREGGTVYANATANIVVAAPGTGWQETRTDIATITGTTFTIGMQIALRLYRNPSDPQDTYGSDSAVATFGYHYQVDMLGSRQATVK